MTELSARFNITAEDNTRAALASVKRGFGELHTIVKGALGFGGIGLGVAGIGQMVRELNKLQNYSLNRNLPLTTKAVKDLNEAIESNQSRLDGWADQWASYWTKIKIAALDAAAAISRFNEQSTPQNIGIIGRVNGRPVYGPVGATRQSSNVTKQHAHMAGGPEDDSTEIWAANQKKATENAERAWDHYITKLEEVYNAELKIQKESERVRDEVNKFLEDTANDVNKDIEKAADDAGERLTKEFENFKSDSDVIIDNLAKDFKSAFDDMINTGKFSFRDFVRFIVAELLKREISAAIDRIAGYLKGAFNTGGGGGGGGFIGFLGSLLGFASGGSFDVGGSGGTDSQLVAFRATPGEHVQVGGGGNTPSITIVQNIDARNSTRDSIENSFPRLMERNNRMVIDRITDMLDRRYRIRA